MSQQEAHMPDRRRHRATRGQTRGRFSGEGGVSAGLALVIVHTKNG